MNIIIKGLHMEITEAIHDYIVKRISSLDKFLKIASKVEVDVGKTTNHHKNGDIFRAELNITNDGEFTRVVSEKEDLYAAIDAVRDEVIEVLSSKKDKKHSLFKKGALKIKSLFKRGVVEDDVVLDKYADLE